MANKEQKVVYISGKYRGDIPANIARAREVALDLWNQGYAVICPHLNTANFPCINDSLYIDGDLTLLSRLHDTDIIYMLKGWRESVGAGIEYRFAKAQGITIIEEGDEPDGF